jgi:hypothetical protein
MNKQKHFLVLCLLWMSIAVQTYAQGGDRLYIHNSGAAVQSYDLNNLQKITFNEQGIILHPSEGNALTFSYESVLTFGSNDVSGIADVAADVSGVQIYYRHSTESVIVESATAVTAASIFNLQGSLIKSLAPQSSQVEISLSGCPAGIYLVKTSNAQGTKVQKIIKQ